MARATGSAAALLTVVAMLAAGGAGASRAKGQDFVLFPGQGINEAGTPLTAVDLNGGLFVFVHGAHGYPVPGTRWTFLYPGGDEVGRFLSPAKPLPPARLKTQITFSDGAQWDGPRDDRIGWKITAGPAEPGADRAKIELPNGGYLLALFNNPTGKAIDDTITSESFGSDGKIDPNSYANLVGQDAVRVFRIDQTRQAVQPPVVTLEQPFLVPSARKVAAAEKPLKILRADVVRSQDAQLKRLALPTFEHIERMFRYDAYGSATQFIEPLQLARKRAHTVAHTRRIAHTIDIWLSREVAQIKSLTLPVR